MPADFTETTVAAVFDLYKSNTHSLSALAAEHALTPVALENLFAQHFGTDFKQQKENAERDKVITLFTGGQQPSEIAATVGIPIKKVTQYLNTIPKNKHVKKSDPLFRRKTIRKNMFNKATVLEIFDKYCRGYTGRKLAQEYDCHTATLDYNFRKFIGKDYPAIRKERIKEYKKEHPEWFAKSNKTKKKGITKKSRHKRRHRDLSDTEVLSLFEKYKEQNVTLARFVEDNNLSIETSSLYRRFRRDFPVELKQISSRNKRKRGTAEGRFFTDKELLFLAKHLRNNEIPISQFFETIRIPYTREYLSRQFQALSGKDSIEHIAPVDYAAEHSISALFKIYYSNAIPIQAFIERLKLNVSEHFLDSKFRKHHGAAYTVKNQRTALLEEAQHFSVEQLLNLYQDFREYNGHLVQFATEFSLPCTAEELSKYFEALFFSQEYRTAYREKEQYLGNQFTVAQIEGFYALYGRENSSLGLTRNAVLGIGAVVSCNRQVGLV